MSTQNERSAKAQIIWNSTDSNSITPTMVGSLFYDINVEKLERDNSNAVYQTYDASYTKVAAINPTTKKMTLIDIPSENGTGITNYVSKFTASGTVGNSIIYDNGGFVGIGTESPTSKLDIRYDSSTSPYRGVSILDVNSSSTSADFITFQKSDESIIGMIRRYNTDNAIFVGGIEFLSLGANNIERIRIISDGKVGIGTKSPSEILDVNGYTKATGFKTPSGTATQSLTANGGTFDLNTKADLVDGKVPSSQLPSYVDDVLEFANLSNFPATGESGKIYVSIDTNKTYRWSGTVYVEISPSLALGETSSTAYRGDRGKTAYDHSQTIGNPHGTTKGDIGLGNVNNTSDLDKPISTATQNALNTKADLAVVDNIQIGGRNLALETKIWKNINLRTVGSIVDSNLKIIENYYANVYTTQTISIAEAGYYTLSFTCLQFNSDKNFFVEFKNSITGAGIKFQQIHLGKNIFTAYLEHGDYYGYSFYGSTQIPNADKYIIIANDIKLEKGNKATDWTPAPEDQISDWNQTNETAFDFIKNKPIDDISKGVQAFNWGNHASQAYLKSSDFNIQNYYTKNEALNLFVGLNGVQTIYDTKTFSSSPIVPNGTIENHAVNLGQLNEKVNNIQIGGRNLFGFNKGIDFQITTVDKSINGYVCNYISDYTVGRIQNLGIKIGGDFTVSMYIKANKNVDVNVNLCDVGTSNSNVSLTTDFVKHIFYFKNVYQYLDSPYFGFLDIECSDISAKVFVKDLKIEQGNKATDWTPAPEDKQDRLQDITGNIGVGKTDASATEKLDVNGNVKATSFFESSLRKYKTNIKKFDKSGIDLVDSLEIVTFDRIDSDVKSKIGIIADDTSDEFLSNDKCAVDLYKTVFIQAKAIQELKSEVDELKEELNNLIL